MPLTAHDTSPTPIAARACRSRRWRRGGAGAVLLTLLMGSAACAKTVEDTRGQHQGSSTATAGTGVPTSSGAAKGPFPGADVKEMQNRLSAVGCDVGRADGVFGPETFRALRAFQASAGLTVDADYGPSTRAALMTAANNRRSGCGSEMPSTTGPSTTGPSTSTTGPSTSTTAPTTTADRGSTTLTSAASTSTTSTTRSADGPPSTATGPSSTTTTEVDRRATTEPTTSVGDGGVAPSCAAGDITAAVVETGAVVRHLDGFGCAGGWAYAFATIDGPPEGVAVTYLLQASGSSWVSADRRAPCDTHGIPDSIFAKACQTN